jgi:competence protein ComEA
MEITSMLLQLDILRSLLLCLLLTALLVTGAVHAQSEDVVDINSAYAATLARVLNGVGPATASRIVAWREANGPFLTVEDLTLVSGIGEKLLARNRDRLVVGGESVSAVDTVTDEPPR